MALSPRKKKNFFIYKLQIIRTQCRLYSLSTYYCLMFTFEELGKLPLLLLSLRARNSQRGRGTYNTKYFVIMASKNFLRINRAVN